MWSAMEWKREKKWCAATTMSSMKSDKPLTCKSTGEKCDSFPGEHSLTSCPFIYGVTLARIRASNSILISAHIGVMDKRKWERAQPFFRKCICWFPYFGEMPKKRSRNEFYVINQKISSFVSSHSTWQRQWQRVSSVMHIWAALAHLWIQTASNKFWIEKNDK